jgi:hypothetical protein
MMLLDPDVQAPADNIGRNHSTSSGSEKGAARTPGRGAQLCHHPTGRARVELGSIPRPPSDEWVSAFTLFCHAAHLLQKAGRSLRRGSLGGNAPSTIEAVAEKLIA